MSGEVIVAFIVGLVLGLLILWIYWRRRADEHQAQLKRLQTSIGEKEQSLASLRSNLREQKAHVEQLEGQLSQSQEVVHDATAQLEARDRMIDELREVVNEQEGQLQVLEAHAKEAEMTASVERMEEVVLPIFETPAPVTEPDNLQRIEGIGSKIAQLLYDAGIVTFTQLAAANVEHLEQILADAGPRFQLADPSTWPRQAELAAAGDWQGLAVLQEALSGGRVQP